MERAFCRNGHFIHIFFPLWLGITNFVLRHPVYKMGNFKYCVIYKYDFHRGTSAGETARRPNDVYGARGSSATTSELAIGCGVSDKTV